VKGRGLRGWRSRFPSREHLLQLRHRWHRILVLAGATGVLVGLGVAGFEWVTANLILDHLVTLPSWAVPLAPGVGLAAAWFVLRTLGRGASPSTADEYLRAYHDRRRRLDLLVAPAKLVASMLTLGFGGAMGFEGPSIYLGAVVGSGLERRYERYFSPEDRRVLLVAGAAAGVSAIFKAPATGALFALEVPYQEDTASHALLPALVASAASYLSYVAIFGLAPLFRVAGSPAFDTRDLLGALAMGVLAGLGARAFAALLRYAKRLAEASPVWRSLTLGAAGMAFITAVSFALYGTHVTFGPGYQAIAWTLGPNRGLALVAALFALRAAATALTIAGGGAGGVFIPLVVQGWLLGSIIETSLHTHTSLFPVIGAAAFLGAGYRTPIAAVVFVAETTGRPGFVVPALVATAVAQLAMGTKSVTAYQIPRRAALPAQLNDHPVTDALETDMRTGAPDALVADLLRDHDAGIIPVVDGDHYLGIIDASQLAQPSAAQRSTVQARDIMRTDFPIVNATWTIEDARKIMDATNTTALPVLRDGSLIGIITSQGIDTLSASTQDNPGTPALPTPTPTRKDRHGTPRRWLQRLTGRTSRASLGHPLRKRPRR
jgi:chloride channel protein, CIC family